MTPENRPERPLASLFEDYKNWLKYGEPHRPYSKHTKRLYAREVGRFIAFLEQEMVETADEVTNAVFRKYFASFIEKGAKPATLRTKLAAIDNFFDWAYLEDLINENPVSRYKKLSGRNGRGGRTETLLPEVLSEEQAVELLNSIYESRPADIGQRDAALVALVLETGLRTSEALELPLSEGSRIVEHKMVRVMGKGRKERVVPIDGVFEGFYLDYIRSKLQSEGASTALLFSSRNGARLTQAAIYKKIRRHLDKQNLCPKQKGLHLLRHTAATLMLSRGLSIAEVQSRLGHSSIAITGRYLHVTPQRGKASYVGSTG